MVGSEATRLLQWLRDYSEERINSSLMDERRSIAPHVVLDFGNQGLLGMLVPKSHGGRGFSYTELAAVLQQLAAIDLTLGIFVALNNILGTYPILHFGTRELADELLPQLAAGRILGGFAVTEPGAGSHPQIMTSRATPIEENRWSITGSKSWIGSAPWAGVINVFVKEINSTGLPIGITGFAVKQGTPGMRCGPEALTLGVRGMVQTSLHLDDVRVTAAERLGLSGKGADVAYETMNIGRFALAALSLGAMKRSLQLMCRHAEKRQIATGNLLTNPVIAVKVQDIISATQAIETLVQRVASLLDSQQRVPPELFLTCKILGPELLWMTVDRLMQTLGGRGYIESNGVPQMFRDARLMRIFEGPTETLEMHLGALVGNAPEKFIQLLLALNADGNFAETIRKDLDELKKASESHDWKSPQDQISTRLLCQSHTGKLASLSIIRSMVPIKDSRWIEDLYDRTLATAKAELRQPATRLAPEQLATILSYQKDIGDVQQHLPGEDFDLDELLKRKQPGKDD